ncbi:MAG: hypothetical protein KatS3mg102_1225 [Planctomycetota bacterium]|nr:MAG: hypothetical protein KatS3mg102_1225 [Planctomycetota bacterium]
MPQTDRDFYKILGVARDASQEEIKRAYKKLARQYHPDLHPGDKQAEARFKEINEAHAVLSDPDKRKLYDEFGELGLREGFDAERARAWKQYAGAAGGPGAGPFAEGGPFRGFRFEWGPGGGGGFESLFEELFGAAAGGAGARGRGRTPPPRRGRDIESEIELGLLEALRGGTMALRVDRGQGPERLEVKLPAGVRDGQRIRLAGMGQPGPAGPGDLYLKVRVRPHPVLERRGDDLLMTVPVTVGEALGGATIPLPLWDGGTVELKVPPGSQNGRLLRLRGLGAPGRGGRKGDLLVRLEVRLPDGGGEQLERLARELDRFYTGEIRAGLRL